MTQPMTPAEAEQLARELLGHLASTRDGANADWDLLADAAARALVGDRAAISVFRRVFSEPGFAVSNSGFEVGYAALGLGLLGDTESLPGLAARSMPYNGIDRQLAAACTLLRHVRTLHRV